MIKNYIKIAWRTILKNRIYSIINILGLTMGIWACMSVATVVIDDLSYDSHWSKGDDLYRLITKKKAGNDQYNKMAASFAGLNPVLMNDFPEVETVSNLNTRNIHLKLHGSGADKVEVNILNADTTVWKMLDFKILLGDPVNYLHDKKNLIITKSFMDKYYPDENPVGKIITDVPSYSETPNSYVITGVIEDIPSNTHLRADALLVQKGRLELLNKQQFGTFKQNYILLKPGTDPVMFANKLSKWYAGFVESDQADTFELQPIKDIYLHSDFAEYQAVKGSYTNIYILSGVALLLLFIACINFINLTTARAIQRMREIGVRKILGAARRQLVIQFLTESFLFFLISTLIANLLYNLSLPYIESYLGHQLEQTFTGFYLIAAALGIILIISLITGGYPALVMSGFNPSSSLKGDLYSGHVSGQNLLRKGLVVLQFSISIIVLIALLVVQQQVIFMENKDTGFNKEGLISIGSVTWDGRGESFKNELLEQPGIQQVSLTTWIPTTGAGYMSRLIEDPSNPGESIEIFFITADFDFARTLELQLEKGRFLEEKFQTDQLSKSMTGEINFGEEEADLYSASTLMTSYTKNLLQIDNLNQNITSINLTPVGVLQNFHTESLRTPMKPTFITAEKSPSSGGMLIRVSPGAETTAMASLHQTWNEFYPNKLLDVDWVDEMMAEQYRAESKLQQLFAVFSGLSMLLAALGILGLIIQITEHRIKEIGVRKVLGASISSIVFMFSKDFLKIVLVAILIATPIGWYAMNKWLQDFSYRIDISWWIFVFAGMVAIIVALLTVSFQAAKAAITNPAKSLRTE